MDNIKLQIEKLVFGGQGIGTTPDGKKAFVWNALPDELVSLKVIKKRKDYIEAIAEEIIRPSKDRIEPLEDNYLATSPWQIINYDAENLHKKSIIIEVFRREHLRLMDFDFLALSKQWNYRNKMEYSFWGDDQGINLALYKRGGAGKQIVSGSKLAMESVDRTANLILAELNKNKSLRAADLKTIVVRSNQQGDTVASLFVKSENFVGLSLPEGVKGLVVYYSNPKSPASVKTKLLTELGDPLLSDSLLGRRIEYNSSSFFQVNIPIFEEVLTDIKRHIGDDSIIDMYGGVGSIGLSVADSPTIIELDQDAADMAKKNSGLSGANVVQASAEKALEYIGSEKTLIVDPPRAGLHKNVTSKILESKPPKIVYLSCNPATHARDIAHLLAGYEIVFFKGYNFFPRTPHIETLAILQRK